MKCDLIDDSTLPDHHPRGAAARHRMVLGGVSTAGIYFFIFFSLFFLILPGTVWYWVALVQQVFFIFIFIF